MGSSGDDLSRAAITGAAWSAVDRFAARGLSFVTFAILGRLLAPEDFGLLAIAAAVISLLSLLVGSGLSEALIRSPTLEKAQLDTAFWISTITGLVLSAVGFALAGPIATAYGNDDLIWVLRALCGTLAVSSLGQVQYGILRREFKFRTLALRSLMATVLGSAVGIAWAILSPSVWALVGQFVASVVAGTVVMWLSCGYRPGARFERAAALSFARFGGNVLGIRSLSFASEQGDTFVVGLVLGATQLGYYAVGFRVYQIVMELVAGTLSAVGLPVFARIQDDRPRIHRAVFKLTRLSTMLAVLFFGMIGVLSGDLIPFLFGPQWGPSVPVMQALAFVGLINACTFFDRSVLLAANRARLELLVTLGATIGNVLAFFVGVQFGIVGVAIALTVRAYIFWPIRLWALRSAVELPVARYLAQWVRPVCCGGGMVGVMLCVGSVSEGAPGFFAQVASGAATYGALVMLLARRNAIELWETLGSVARPMSHSNGRTPISVETRS
jgi:teichuronic acid exporter